MKKIFLILSVIAVLQSCKKINSDNPRCWTCTVVRTSHNISGSSQLTFNENICNMTSAQLKSRNDSEINEFARYGAGFYEQISCN